jgi:hypothetical protein
LLYADDSLHQRAVDLMTRLENEGHSLALLDLLVFEASSVLCRRAAQRKAAPPDLAAAVATMRSWFDNGEVRFLAHQAEQIANSVLDIVTSSHERRTPDRTSIRGCDRDACDIRQALRGHSRIRIHVVALPSSAFLLKAEVEPLGDSGQLLVVGQASDRPRPVLGSSGGLGGGGSGRFAPLRAVAIRSQALTTSSNRSRAQRRRATTYQTALNDSA